MTQAPIIVEQILLASPARVWQAIANRDHMKDWYFDLVDFRPQVGFEFQFDGGTEENTYRHLCQVTEADENQKLTYSWHYDGYAGNSFVTFELFPEGKDQTRIRLTHAGTETFPADNPDLARKNFEAGWLDIIGKLLPEYLASKSS